ncbi:MAG: hypothetical protein KJ804_17450 [Proteobacteria bacterium]|nr:hypothetical protein [Pseudomonadota bacterium]
MFDIVGPFLCTLDHWEFFTGTVTAAPSTVDITEVTEAEASIVDYFTLTVGGTQVEANAASFSAVTNSIQLESVLEGLSTLFDVTLSGTTLTFTTTATGPIALTDLHLEFSTPASIATV